MGTFDRWRRGPVRRQGDGTFVVELDPEVRAMVGRFVDELRELEAQVTLPLRDAWALIAQGDEVLDWREMVLGCEGAHMTVLAGGDHAISDFDSHLDALMRFLHPI